MDTVCIIQQRAALWRKIVDYSAPKFPLITVESFHP
jgi:hypothetical protein